MALLYASHGARGCFCHRAGVIAAPCCLWGVEAWLGCCLSSVEGSNQKGLKAENLPTQNPVELKDAGHTLLHNTAFWPQFFCHLLLPAGLRFHSCPKFTSESSAFAAVGWRKSMQT